MLRNWQHVTAAVVVLSLAIGCTQKAAAPASGDAETTVNVVDDHSGWWCNEHGVPEGECGMCNSELAAKFQKQGDWCKEHDRPDSQCFACHPELEAQFAARYEAKYGKKPPKPQG